MGVPVLALFWGRPAGQGWGLSGDIDFWELGSRLGSGGTKPSRLGPGTTGGVTPPAQGLGLMNPRPWAESR